MSRPEKPPAAVVAPRVFIALAVGFLLLYGAILVFAVRQKAARAELETVVPLPLPTANPNATPKPAPTPFEP